MDQIVKSSIDGRKQAFYTAYNITDKELIEKIEELFTRINEFGEECSDAGEFETRFQSSPLNKEYIDMFTLVASKCPANNIQSEANPNVTTTSDQVADEISSEIRYQVNEATMPARRKAREKMESEMRSTPIIGDAMEIKQHGDFFGRFRKKKDEE